MKILVIDDKEVNRLSAIQTLQSEHDLTVVGTVDEFLHQISAGKWDAVLCDLQLPNSMFAEKHARKGYPAGMELPIGIALAISAATAGAKYVAVASDTSHHGDSTSWMLNCAEERIFSIAGAHAMFTDDFEFVEVEITPTLKQMGKDWSYILSRAMRPVGSFR